MRQPDNLDFRRSQAVKVVHQPVDGRILIHDAATGRVDQQRTSTHQAQFVTTAPLGYGAAPTPTAMMQKIIEPIKSFTRNDME